MQKEEFLKEYQNFLNINKKDNEHIHKVNFF
jgi:hypothetical protein